MDAVDRDSGDAALRLLRRAGLRLTPQRVAIVRALLGESHPTAAEVYEAVRRRFPALGLATVYATLNTLVALGQIHELPFADAARYDANTAPHVNLVCTRCGQITDFVDCEDALILLSARAADLALF